MFDYRRFIKIISFFFLDYSEEGVFVVYIFMDGRKIENQLNFFIKNKVRYKRKVFGADAFVVIKCFKNMLIQIKEN